MTNTPHLGLPLTPAADDQKKFIQFRTEIAGDGDDSALMIVDRAIQKLDQSSEDLAGRTEYIENTKFTWGKLLAGFYGEVPAMTGNDDQS